ncbi:type II toxin-antitoxin system PemK/MazF family toxin [Deinococcus sp. SL84]|uniref:type II toxin-antitoxin system PemK/MazF family toxin n=1 Tax=Deinococcus sp. SL84 TaxID=2994663 RepID=UPI002276189C|nr:type II toxin-antitoxin system PemK/MazF family toxin [Deinococcus sp. SL84]MCY1704315.1 type II toxin-antitoxin system PemK/MazF family toxin [Deinococcus sp. SL84]
MVIQRGDIWWVDLGEPVGSRPGFRRPVLVIQADSFNRSGLNTVLTAILSSNEVLANAPGNVLLEPEQTRLPKPSVVNVTSLQVVNKSEFLDYVHTLSLLDMRAVDAGLHLVLGL